VPTLVCTPPADRLWHVLALLLAPPVVAYAAAHYLGTGLSAKSIKLSARQLAALPLPRRRGAWDRGADLARAAHATKTGAQRDRLLGQCAAQMCTAYGVTGEVLEWWTARAGLAAPRPTSRG
jgi:hypothetical protein